MNLTDPNGEQGCAIICRMMNPDGGVKLANGGRYMRGTSASVAAKVGGIGTAALGTAAVAGYGCAVGGCAAIGTAVTSTSATTVTVGSGVISGGVSALNGDSPGKIVANTVLGATVAKVGTMSKALAEKVLVPASAALLGMAAIDVADDGQINSISSDGGNTLNGNTIATTAITAVTSVIPAIPPLVLNAGGAAADTALQHSSSCQSTGGNEC